MALLLLMNACAAPVPPACTAAPDGPVVWVVDYGWHTELVVPAELASGPLDLFRRMFPAARTLSFGFGKTSFMTLPHPGFADFLLGAIPGQATVRVIPLSAEPGRIYTSPVTRVPLTPTQWDALAGFLWHSFRHGTDGRLLPIPANDETGGRFFQASPGYSLAYTCNAWTIDALHQAGLPVPGHVVLASGTMDQVAHLQGACATP
jgi:hypothetical protein